MKTPKLLKGIAKKFKNRKGSSIATTAKGSAIKESRTSNNMSADVEEVKVEVKEQTNVDKATETDTQLCNENSEIEQPIFESSKEAQIVYHENACSISGCRNSWISLHMFCAV